MLTALAARELGDVAETGGLWDLRRARWSSLRLDPRRTIDAGISDNLISLDIDNAAGQMMLFGTADTREGTGSVGVFRITPADKRASPVPLVTSTSSYNGELDPVAHAKWLPGDPGLFVSGSATSPVVSVWDTEAFEPVATYYLASRQVEDAAEGEMRGTVLSMSMSSAPGAKRELVATAVSGSNEVILVDLGTGACTHRLRGHSADITDVCFHSTNPYLLASTDYAGHVRMFDIRRAGPLACLTIFDKYKTLPFVEQEEQLQRQRQPLPARRGAAKRPRISQDNKLLGLRMAWGNAATSATIRHQLSAKERNTAGRAHFGPARRVCFSPDGCKVCTMGDDGIRVWDSLSAHCLTQMFTIQTGVRERRMVFAVSGDSSYIFQGLNGALLIHDIANGSLVCRRRGQRMSMEAMCVHPFYEELYTAGGTEILCWAPPRVEVRDDHKDLETS